MLYAFSPCIFRAKRCEISPERRLTRMERLAIKEAERAARWDEDDTVDYPAWTL